MPYKKPKGLKGDALFKSKLDFIFNSKDTSKQLNQVTEHDIRIKKGEMHEHTERFNAVHKLLHAMFEKAIRWEYYRDKDGNLLYKNPIALVKKYPKKSRVHKYDAEQMQRIISAILAEENIVLRSYATLFLLTGARASEATNAEWTEFNLDKTGGIWRIPHSKNKQNEDHFRPLSYSTIIFLRQYRKYIVDNYGADCRWLFPCRYWPSQDVPINNGQSKFWRRLQDKTGTMVRPHALRHNFGAYIVSGGMTKEVAGRLLGHRPGSQATDVYSHFFDSTLRDGANIMGDIAEGFISTSNRKLQQKKGS